MCAVSNVERKRAQSLDRVHQKKQPCRWQISPMAFEIGPKAAQVLDEADGQELGALAGAIDRVERIGHRKPVDADARCSSRRSQG